MLGREEQWGEIERILACARASTFSVIRFTGEAGEGKTELCRSAVERATGITVIEILGVEWESNLPFAGLSQMLIPLRSHVDELAPAQRSAVRAVCRDAGQPGLDQFALAGGALAALSLEAAEHPVLVVVDDAQWLDAASIAALSFVFRRLSDDAVAVVIAARPNEGPTLPGLWRVHHLGGLDEADTTTLLTRHAPTRVAPDVAGELWTRTGGNPLALIELAGELGPRELEGHAPLPDPLPLGPRGMISFGRRLEALPASTQASLTIAAAAGSAGPSILAAALDRAGHSLHDIEPAEKAQVVRWADGRLVFRPPLVRSAAYLRGDAAALREAHRILADVLVDDVERHAWHVAAATLGPSEEAASAMDRAAEAAERRGGIVAGMTARVRAAELTPVGPDRPRRVLAAAETQLVAGQRERAMELTEELLRSATEPSLRSAALLLRARSALMGSGSSEALPDVRRSFEQLGAEGDSNAVRVGLVLTVLLAILGRWREMPVVTAALLDLVDLDERLRPVVEAFDVGVRLFIGDDPPAPVDEAEARRLVQVAQDGDLDVWAPYLAQFLSWIGRDHPAAQLLEAQVDRAERLCATSVVAVPLSILAHVQIRLGELIRARASCERAAVLGAELGTDGLTAFIAAARAQIAAVEGDAAACREAVTVGLGAAELAGQLSVLLCLHHARGLLALGCGRAAEAVTHLERAQDLREQTGLVLPSVVMWQGDHIEALMATGNRARAEAALTVLEADSEATRSDWGRGVALRGRARLDPARSEPLLRESSEVLSAYPFEHARSRLSLGEVLRRSGHVADARAELSAAADLFSAMGAHPWCTRAESALRATGVRRSRRGTAHQRLTEQEQQVALLIADGATNKEAAAALMLSPKTVEYHLSKAFRKLGVSNRTQLARALSPGQAS